MDAWFRCGSAGGVEVVIACIISDIVLTIEKAWELESLRDARFQMLPRVDQREVYREAINPKHESERVCARARVPKSHELATYNGMADAGTALRRSLG
jgi:hypothetical protein